MNEQEARAVRQAVAQAKTEGWREGYDEAVELVRRSAGRTTGRSASALLGIAETLANVRDDVEELWQRVQA